MGWHGQHRVRAAGPTAELIERGNPYHDEHGRFTTADGALPGMGAGCLQAEAEAGGPSRVKPNNETEATNPAEKAP